MRGSCYALQLRLHPDLDPDDGAPSPLWSLPAVGGLLWQATFTSGPANLIVSANGAPEARARVAYHLRATRQLRLLQAWINAGEPVAPCMTT